MKHSRIPQLSAALLVLTTLATAQSQLRLTELRDAKLQLPFLGAIDWVRDFTAAQARATRTRKLIFAYFTRSDERCADSMLLECGPFAEAGFATFADKVVPFCHITSRVKTDKDQQLFRQKGGRVFPRIVFMNALGKVLYEVKGEKVASFERGLAELEALAQLEQRVKSGDRAAVYALLTKQLQLHHIEYPLARSTLKKMRRLTKTQKQDIAPLMLECEILYLAAQTEDNVKARTKTGEKFYRMKKKGLDPTGDAILPFWQHMLVYAESRKKPLLYEEALDTLKQEFPGIELPEEERTLRRLKSK